MKEQKSLQERVLAVLDEEMTDAMIAHWTNEPIWKVRRALNRLRAMGRVQKIKPPVEWRRL